MRSLRDTTIALVKALVEQGVLSQAKADELIRKAQEAGRHPANYSQAPSAARTSCALGQAESAGDGRSRPPTHRPPTDRSSAPKPGEPPVIRVPYVPETVKQEIRDEVKKEVLAQAKEERWGEPGASAILDRPDSPSAVTFVCAARLIAFRATIFPMPRRWFSSNPSQVHTTSTTPKTRATACASGCGSVLTFM